MCLHWILEWLGVYSACSQEGKAGWQAREDKDKPDPIQTHWHHQRQAGPHEDHFFLTLCHRATHTPGLELGKAEKGYYGNWTSFGLISTPYQQGEPTGQHQWLVPSSDFHSSVSKSSESWANFSYNPTLTWNSEKRSSSSAHWTQYKSPLRVACFGGRGQEGNWEEAPRGHLAYWQCFTSLPGWWSYGVHFVKIHWQDL